VDLLTLAAGATDLELRLTRSDGSHSQVLLETVPTDRGTIFALRDITAQRMHEEQLWYTAHHDALTGLPNRSLLWQRFAAAGSESYAVLLIDLDGFKAVNDTFGHQAGDELLRAVAQRVRHVCGSDATVARLGGDEFAVFLPRSAEEQARYAQDAIGSCFAREFRLSIGAIRVGGSIGYALGAPGRSPDEVMAAADAAMYACKRAGLDRRTTARA
jgi:diguanylate cyclase (GGDEF)-like protein